MKNFTFILITFLLSIQNLQAQKLEQTWLGNVIGVNDTIKWVGYDPLYVEDYSQHWTVRLISTYKNNSFEVLNRNTEGAMYRIKYSPVAPYSVGIGLNHKWIGFNASFTLSEGQDGLKDTSKQLDLITRIYGRKIGGEFRIQYFNKHKAIISPLENQQDINLSGIPFFNSIFVTGNAMYVFNQTTYSYMGSITQTQWQKQSSGSWLVGGLWDYHILWNHSTTSSDDLKQLNLRNNHYLSIGVTGGYGHTFVFKKHFYVGGTFMAGPSVSNVFQSDLINGDRNDHFLRPSLMSIGRIGIGYNSDIYFAGIQGIYQSNVIFWENQDPRYRSGYLRIAVGRRFNWEAKSKVLKGIGLH
ncbi:DUF4421 family protein [Sediminitomix flava]|uniref:Uncharacterized protein DUF4421 n=1 Tax=Sediminitomix flava TaxID=379075 RepID=A0A315ZBM4_SEDFL|nr:DUF4421 family protein [Sediminitomix flava]PWJ42559.1 uncharacterized protein DUF4421 [Sediminitomix flava]